MAQVQTKFVANNAINDTKERLQSAAYLRSRNNANTADVNIIRTNASDVIEFPSVPQIASGTPSANADITNVSYVQGQIVNLPVKNPVVVASLTNLTLSGTQTIDGVAVIAGQRVLAAGQTTSSANGIYIVASGAWSRSTDFNSSAAVYEGVEIPVAEGTANAGFYQLNATGGTVTIGTTALTFSKIGPAASVTVPTITKQTVTLASGDITNQYYDLAHVAKASSIDLVVAGLIQVEGTDYTVNLTGGTGGNTRVTFAGDLASAGNAALVAGDIVVFKYSY